MKRLILILLILLLLLGAFSACNTAVPAMHADGGGRTSIVATIFPPYDFARELVGDIADVSMLLPPATESHSFEPSPKDILKLQSCDVFIYVGGPSDAWVDEVLSSMDTSRMQIVTLMDCVDVVAEEHVEGMEAEHEDEHEDESELDEHVWTSPKNAMLITEKIAEAICAADEKNTAAYSANRDAYLAKLQGLDDAFWDVVNGSARKTIVFGDRFPFRYFTDEFGLNYFAAFPGCSTESEPSVKTVAFLIDKVRNEHIPVVFYLELSSTKMADTICEDSGAKPLLFHSCHNISRDDFMNGVSYLDLMYGNVAALKEALS